MKTVRTVCNSYLVNSYIVIAEDNTSVLIDPACSSKEEFNRFLKIADDYKLNVVASIITHPHADHVMGVKFMTDAFPQAELLMHQEGLPLYRAMNDYSLIMGFQKKEIPNPTRFVCDNELLKFSDIELKVLYTPGHSPGSICLYAQSNNMVFSGDVLFQNSIGRTDLPGGSFELLKKSIYEKLFTLPDDTIVLPGHGDQTNIEYEKKHNPFL
ncbi:MAG: MBL fold metallo-hydrolase [Bacteroidales bacterium]|jgi:glyoxylase-like metal-dependent hydrolase (beta-lactamase superfamily II)|nr:MBL fold metallo-hydrolase [Bacteroidales bacterium]